MQGCAMGGRERGRRMGEDQPVYSSSSVSAMAMSETQCCARRWPAATAVRHNTIDKAIFARALPHAPERTRSKVWRLKEEKVVNPPQIPIMTKIRRFSETGYFPLCRVSVPK